MLLLSMALPVAAQVDRASLSGTNNLTNYASTANPYNVTSQWARNSSDRQHYWSTSMMWNVPVGKGKRFKSHKKSTRRHTHKLHNPSTLC